MEFVCLHFKQFPDFLKKKSKILSQKKIISKGCILINITSLHQNYTSYVFEYQRIKNS